MPKVTPPRQRTKASATKKKESKLPLSDGRRHSRKITPAYDRDQIEDVFCRVEGCAEKLDSTDKLFEHMKVHHVVKHDQPVGAKLYKCCWAGCTKENPFTVESLMDHYRRHTGARLSCPFEESNPAGEVVFRCPEVFADHPRRSRHFVKEHNMKMGLWLSQKRAKTLPSNPAGPVDGPLPTQPAPPPSSTDVSVVREVQMPIASAPSPQENPVTPKKTRTANAQQTPPKSLAKRSPGSPKKRGRRLSPRKAKAQDTSNAENAAPSTTSDEKAKPAGPPRRRLAPLYRAPRFINSAQSRASSVVTVCNGSVQFFAKTEVDSGEDHIDDGWDDETVTGDFVDVDLSDVEEELEVNVLLSFDLPAKADGPDVSMDIGGDEDEVVLPDSDGDEDPYDGAPATKRAAMDIEESTSAVSSRSHAVKVNPSMRFFSRSPSTRNRTPSKAFAPGRPVVDATGLVVVVIMLPAHPGYRLSANGPVSSHNTKMPR